MFFAEHEKTIYFPPGSEKGYDPLAVERSLTLATGGELDGILADWQAVGDTQGDMSLTDADRKLMSALAEEKLVAASRKAFGLSDFPQTTDATALEILVDYLRWMEGKGEPARGRQQSPGSSRDRSSPATMTSSSSCT